MISQALDKPATPALMRHVMLGLIPGTAIMSGYFGWGVIFNVCLAVLAAMLFEALALAMRTKPIAPTLSDGSAALAGWLLALALPPLLPWWITVMGCAAAMLLGKHLYGGLGFNPFNPAMVGYAFLLISFPRDMTAWVSPEASLSLMDSLTFLFSSLALTGAQWDAITIATPLDQFKSALRTGTTSEAVINGRLPWQIINSGFLLGGLYLLYKKIITWHIPLSLLTTLAAAYTIEFVFFGGTLSPPAALFSGAAMLAAFFIATDPVSAATSPRGRVFYAAGIGLLIFIIRKWGHYPEGVAFAVLLMNLVAPTIDYFYRPKAAGT